MNRFHSFRTPSLMLAALFTSFCGVNAQGYKIGDNHPQGGIVFVVDASGTKGKVVTEQDNGIFTPPEAIEAARGTGWALPYMKDLQLVYRNLHKQGKGNFQDQLYQALDASSPQYRKGIHFDSGKEETGIAQNNKTLTRFVRDFKPGLKEAIEAKGGTWAGNWSWPGDDSAPSDHSKLIVKSATEFTYTYMDQVHQLQGQLQFSEPSTKATLYLDLDLPDGNHLRFEWKSENEIHAQFWNKGQKENQQPVTTSKMLRVSN